MHKKHKKSNAFGEANLWRKAPKTYQQTGGSDFPETAGSTIGSPLIVPASTRMTSDPEEWSDPEPETLADSEPDVDPPFELEVASVGDRRSSSD